MAELADAAVFKTETFAGCAGSNPAGVTSDQGEEMARETKNMKALQSRLDIVRREIDRIGREMEKARAQEALLLDMMREESGKPPAEASKVRARRFNIKTTVLELLERTGDSGLNAAIAVDMAATEGKAIERGSVSSVLSRLKNDGVVQYDGNVYRLIQRRSDDGAVVHLRTSGVLQ
ncbi:hypothetical protein [Rubellimicrobium sp. CFH 75288]|uniref:hypothetical protein n=1 Tax=Rubellimicrobium sp. CFH 75288 TaxID=2697034 RepID=UPI00141351E2|nr:hypothetical protein [Rubellimicrobium sp. CFH 75288]NAZ36159.1 hypothetical protein [Rubellimicrobium sp. CFH 75288]